jgi:hypothetical protein
MAESSKELYVLYQMGASEEFTWFSVVAVFLSGAALSDYIRRKGIALVPLLVDPSPDNEVLLAEPREFVGVRSREGPVPDVELAEQT